MFSSYSNNAVCRVSPFAHQLQKKKTKLFPLFGPGPSAPTRLTRAVMCDALTHPFHSETLPFFPPRAERAAWLWPRHGKPRGGGKAGGRGEQESRGGRIAPTGDCEAARPTYSPCCGRPHCARCHGSRCGSPD